MNNPVLQHDLPKTYLKRFVGDPANRAKKSFVWCFWHTQHETKLQEESIGSKRFTIPDFYTVDGEEPYSIEHWFQTEIEPLYNKIVGEIEAEQSLSEACRKHLLIWFFFNKYRNRAVRDRFTELAKETSGVSLAGQEAKDLHLEYLFTQEIAERFWSAMAAKEWIVLKAHPKFPFITSDNPGFSIVREQKGAEVETMSSNYSIEEDKTNYFIISPEYCLEVTPHRAGTPVEVNFHNQYVTFKEAGLPMIRFINGCTVACRTKYLISNDKRTLEKYGALAEKMDEAKAGYDAAMAKFLSNFP